MAKKLKDLTKEHIGLEIQQGEHNSVVDAKAAMLLYKKVSREWEASLRGRTSVAGGSRMKKMKKRPSSADADRLI